ncbi:amino acid adenylation domain-containing protein [Dactylosporangium sp. NPDC005572]|uniref:amino acid adenylation domain-containing protein n=1 Tax=Dactylosporangium sp. NPDC005572 TaxID=3156889 RepID=UPI0033A0C947
MTDVTQPTAGTAVLLGRLRQRGPERATAAGFPAVPRTAPPAASSAQRRLWFLDRLRPGGVEYLVPIVLRLRGPLDPAVLAEALTALAARHEVLRTRYGAGADGEPVQLVDPPALVPLPVSGGDEDAGAATVAAALAEPFDLAAGPVLRARLVRLAPDHHVLVLVIHHIAVDGWSCGVLVRELADLCAGRDLPDPVQYADFAAWQRAQDTDDGLRYWRERLRGLAPPELLTDRRRPVSWQPAGATVPFELPAELGAEIGRLAGAHRATRFMVYLAGLWALLHRYTGQTDLAVSTPVAGRTHPGTHELVGFLVNLLVLRADLSGAPTFAVLLDRARETALSAYAHQDVPFERVVDALAVDRDVSAHPFTTVNLTLQNTEPLRFAAGPVAGEAVPVPSDQAKFDLSWTLEERPDGSVAGEVTFPHALFDAETVAAMAEHYGRLLAAAVADPGRRVDDLPLLDAGEEGARLTRRPVAAPPDGPCLHERFAAHTEREPCAVALTSGTTRMSYGELEAKANRLARRLRQAGAGREALVGILLPRGTDMIVALLAALKAGAAYLPLDPQYPDERIAFQVRDAAAPVVVTTTADAPRLQGLAAAGVAVLALDDPQEAARIDAQPAGAPDVRVHPDDLAYVIYTSGSSGRPKGVRVTHANAARLFTATDAQFRFGPFDVWALFHSFAFDFSVWEIWGALAYGGRLVIVPQETARSPWDLVTLLADEGVTVLNQTPSAFRSLVELARRGEAGLDRLRLRLVVFGGEALDVPMLAPWWQRFGDETPRLVNMYGITETTVHVTFRALDRRDLDGDRSPIGAPLTDLSLSVLDPRMRPAPVGVPGELYVGGAGVARDYLGLPRLTAERFVPDPAGPPGARLYRSGDKARLLRGGDIGFLGRLDDQVKIRGFRIELDEVGGCIAGHADVAAAVAGVHEPEPGQRQLVGYVVPKDGAAPAGADLRAYVAARLPGYMVPAAFVLLPKLPMTANGKVDRRALPAPSLDGPRAPAGPAAPVAPRDATEAAVARIWAEVLGSSDVGVQDNFFSLGGDSIRAVQLVGRLRAAGYHATVQDVFRHQSVAELVGATGGGPGTAERVGTAPFALLDPDDRERLPAGLADAYPMARVQAGMVYELLADPQHRPYHNVTSYLIRDDGEFDAAALRAALDAVVARHEILRTSFDLTGFSEPLQLVHERAEIELAHGDLRGLPQPVRLESMRALRATERARLFDLAAAPLIRFHAHRAEERRWYLTLTEFHAILDGWSHNSLVSEILAGYRAARDGAAPRFPAGPPVRYADFIAQEQHSLRDPADREFWRGRLDGADRLTIPPAWAGDDGDGSDDGDAPIAVAYRDLETPLRELALRAGASLKSVLLAAHLAVWRTVAGDGPFHTGLVCNGRTETEGGDQVRGMFLNPVPFVAPTGWATWTELVRATFAEEVELWPHRRFPLAELQRAHGGGERLVEVAFNYLDFHVLDRQAVDTEGSVDVSPNEFPFAVSTQGGALLISAQPARVGRAHAEVLARMYRAALEAMAADPDADARGTLLAVEDQERLVRRGARRRGARPDRGLHELVAEHAATTPDAVAVEAAGATLTYRQLDERAAAWAGWLADAGVGRGDLVGLRLPRVPDLIAALLGTLRVGAAYVPVDPAEPAERVDGILRDAGVRAVAAEAGPGAHPPVPTVHHPDPDELVYAVHTSGSTGRPKGVMVTHGALTDRVWSMRRTMRVRQDDVVVAVVPITTDVAQLAAFVALANGARLVLAGADLARDPQSLAALLAGSGATFMQASPTTWRMLLATGWRPPAGFRLLSGGEAMDAELVRRLAATRAEVWNMYGPSEATVFCFGTRLADRTFVPAANTTVYLLDERLRPVPDGLPAQLYIGGNGLARGYLRRPATTAAAFLPDPWAGVPGARMYATGDIARRDREGRVEILGRRDHQLKIRGVRIELGEVENVLARHPGVRAAVAQPVPGPDGSARLAAYVLPERPTADPADLLAFAARHLPPAVVPAHLILLDELPRLPNGKVDRGALPAPTAAPPAPVALQAPVGAVEEAVAEVWQDVLGDAVGRDTDFFQAGGHSLLMLRVVAQLQRRHDLTVTFRDLLAGRTVRGVAAAIAASGPRATQPALVPFGRQTPRLHCLHPGGGSAHWYRHLAAHVPLAAFEWPGLHDPSVTADGVAGIAERYLAELPEGRPVLLGWCGSSAIAWEMARRLHAAGAAPRLVLLDPVVDLTRRTQHRPLTSLATFRRAEALFAALPGLPAEARDAARAELLGLVRGAVDDGDVWLTDDDLGDAWAHRLRGWRELLEARLGYRFEPYPGEVDLILGDELADGWHESIQGLRYDEYLAHWRDLAAGGLRVHRVAGDHLGLLRPPAVAGLARVLTALLDHGTETEES